MHWLGLLTVASVLGVVIRVTHKPRSSIELSPEATKQLREMEHKHFIVRAKAQKDSK